MSILISWTNPIIKLDRDFYYGDPYFEPQEPIEGLLSKDYARERLKLITDKNIVNIKPGNPYNFQEGSNPFLKYIDSWETDNNLSDGTRIFYW